MNEASPNRDLYRIYAAACLIGSATVVAIAFELSDLPDIGIIIYLAIGVALWCVDMLVTTIARGATAHAGRQGHGLAHAVLIAGFALVWPLAVVAVLAFLGRGVVKALQ